MRPWLLGMLLAMALVAGHGPAALADAELDSTGWWWRAQTGLVAPLPPPPGVPEGGLVVSAAPDGPAAVAALRFHVDGDPLAATLTLAVASDQGGAAASIDACVAGQRWRPARAGGWEERPAANCSAGSVAGSASDDGRSWFFDVAALIRGGALDIVLHPPGGAPFQVVFEAPNSSSLEVTTVSEPGSFEPPPAAGEFAPPPSDASSPAFDAPAPPPRQGFTPFSGAAGEPPVAGAPEVAPAESLPQPQAAGAEAPQAAQAPTAPTPTEPLSEQGQPLGLLLVLATVGAAMLLQRQQTPAVVGLGRFQQPAPPVQAPGGLGRFARTRTGAPPPLR